MEDVDRELLLGPVPACSKVPSFDCESEGLKYVAGYVASKFLDKFPDLGQKTSDYSVFEETTAPWITALSKGGLVVPSEEFLSKVYQMEQIFLSVHGSEISKEHRAIEKLSSLYIKKVPSVPKEVAKKFAKTRTFIRLKYLNCKLHLAQGEGIARRKRKQLEQFSK